MLAKSIGRTMIREAWWEMASLCSMRVLVDNMSFGLLVVIVKMLFIDLFYIVALWFIFTVSRALFI